MIVIEGFITTIISITMATKSLLFLLLPVTPDLKTRVLSSSSLDPSDIIVAGTNKLISAYALDVVSNILSASAEYLYTFYRPQGGTLTLTLTNTAEIGGQVLCDILSIYTSWLAWQINAQFASAFCT